MREKHASPHPKHTNAKSHTWSSLRNDQSSTVTGLRGSRQKVSEIRVKKSRSSHAHEGQNHIDKVYPDQTAPVIRQLIQELSDQEGKPCTGAENLDSTLSTGCSEYTDFDLWSDTVTHGSVKAFLSADSKIQYHHLRGGPRSDENNHTSSDSNSEDIETVVLEKSLFVYRTIAEALSKIKSTDKEVPLVCLRDIHKVEDLKMLRGTTAVTRKELREKTEAQKTLKSVKPELTRTRSPKKQKVLANNETVRDDTPVVEKKKVRRKGAKAAETAHQEDADIKPEQSDETPEKAQEASPEKGHKSRSRKPKVSDEVKKVPDEKEVKKSPKKKLEKSPPDIVVTPPKSKQKSSPKKSPSPRRKADTSPKKKEDVSLKASPKEKKRQASMSPIRKTRTQSKSPSPSPSRKRRLHAASEESKTSSLKLDIPETETSGNAKRTRSPSARFKEDIILYPWESARKSPKKSPVSKTVEKSEADRESPSLKESPSKEKLNLDQGDKSVEDKSQSDITLSDKSADDKHLDDESTEDKPLETNPTDESEDETSPPKKAEDKTDSPRRRKKSPQKEKSETKETTQEEPMPGPSTAQVEQVTRALTFDADVTAVEGISSAIPKDFQYKYQPTKPSIPLSDLISKVSSALESSDEKLKLLFGEAEEPDDVEEMEVTDGCHGNDDSVDSDRTLTEFNNSATLNTSIEDADKETEKEITSIPEESAKENKNLEEDILSSEHDKVDQDKAPDELKSDKDELLEHTSAETSVPDEPNCDTNKAAIPETEEMICDNDESQTVKDSTKTDQSDNAQEENISETNLNKNDNCSNLIEKGNKDEIEETAEDEILEETNIFDMFGLKLKKQPTQNKTDTIEDSEKQNEISNIDENKENEKSEAPDKSTDAEKVTEQMNADDDDDVMIIGESSPKKEVIVLSDVESPEKADAASARLDNKAKFKSVNKCVEPKPLEILTRHEKSDEDKRSVFLSHELEAYIAVNKENVVPSSDNKCESAVDMKRMLDNPYPDFDELDDVMFLSFPCEQALKAHVNLEKKIDWLNDGSIRKMGQLKAMRERQQDQGARRLTDVKIQTEQKQNYRGYPMRMTKYNKLLKQELEAILYGYEDSAQMPFQKTPEKTHDITKIKGWKHKFKNAEEMQAAAGLQVSDSGKVHWKTEERLLKNLDPDDVQGMGIDLQKKRRKPVNFTKKKGSHKNSPDKSDESDEDFEDWENWEGAITEKDVYNENDEKTPPEKIPYREKYHSQHKYGARKQFVKTMGLDSRDELILKKLGTQKLMKDFEDPQKEEQRSNKKSYFTLSKLSHSMAVAASWAVDKALISRSKAMSKGTPKDKKRGKQRGIKSEVRAAPAYTYRIEPEDEDGEEMGEEDYTEHDEDDVEGSSESEDEGTEGYEEMDPHDAEADTETPGARPTHSDAHSRRPRLRHEDTETGGRATPRSKHDDATEAGTGRLRSRQRTSSKAAEVEAREGAETEAGRTRAAHRASRLSREQIEEQLEQISRDKKKQPRKENCDQPGCRFGCVCHLCKLSDSSEEKEADVKPLCDKEYCKLGCICESIDAKMETKTHCRKPACMLGCKCPPRQPKPDIPKEHQGHKGKKKKTRKDKKRKTHMQQKEEEEVQVKEEPSVMYDDAEDWEPPSKRKRGSNNSRFANLPKRQSTYRLAKNLDAVSRKAMEVYNSSEVYAQMKIRRRKSDPVYDIEMDIDQPSDMTGAEMERHNVPRDAPMRRKSGHDQGSKGIVFEISDEESDGEQFPPDLESCQRTTLYEGLRRKRQGLRRRDSQNSGTTSTPVVIDLIDSDEDNSERPVTQADRSSFPCSSGSGQVHSSAGRQTVSEKLGLSRKHGEDSSKWKTQMVCLKAKRKAEDRTTGPQSEIKLLEIISNCNWEADRTNMLSKISHIISKAKDDGLHSNSVIMWQNYIMHFLPRANRPAVIPPELQSKLPNAMYSIRVRVTQNISDTEQGGENDLDVDEKDGEGEDVGREVTEEQRKQQNVKLQKKLIDKIKFAEKLRDLIMAEEKKGSDPSKFSVSLEGIQKALKKYKTQLWKAYTGSNNMTLMQLKKAVAAAKSGKPGSSGASGETRVGEGRVNETRVNDGAGPGSKVPKDGTFEPGPAPSVVGFQQQDMNATLARIHANQGLKIVCPKSTQPGFIPVGHLAKNMMPAVNSAPRTPTSTTTIAPKPGQPVSQITSPALTGPHGSMQQMTAGYSNISGQRKMPFTVKHKPVGTPASLGSKVDGIAQVATSQVSTVSGGSEVLLIPVPNTQNSNWNPNVSPVLSAKMTVLPNGNATPVTMQNGAPNISKVVTPTSGVITRFPIQGPPAARFPSPGPNQSIANLRSHQTIGPGQIVLTSSEPGKAPIVLNAIQPVSSSAPTGYSQMQIIRPQGHIKLSANTSMASPVISQQIPQTTRVKQVISGIPTKAFLSPAVAAAGDRKPLSGIPANTSNAPVSPMCSVYPIRLAPGTTSVPGNGVPSPIPVTVRPGYPVGHVPPVRQRLPVQQVATSHNQNPASGKFLAIGDLENAKNVTVMKPQPGQRYTTSPITVINSQGPQQSSLNKTKELTQRADQKTEVVDLMDQSVNCSKPKVPDTELEAGEKEKVDADSDTPSKQAPDSGNSDLKEVVDDDETEDIVEEEESELNRLTKPEVGEHLVIASKLVPDESQDSEKWDSEKISRTETESEEKVSKDSSAAKNVEKDDAIEDQQDHGDMLQVVNNAAIDIANALHSIDYLDQTDTVVNINVKDETAAEDVKKDKPAVEDLQKKDVAAVEDLKKDVTVIDDEDSDGCLIIDEAESWTSKPSNSQFTADELSLALEQRETLLEERKKRKLGIDVGETVEQPAKKRCTPGPVTLMSNTEETDDIDVTSFDGNETDSLRAMGSGRRKSKQKMKWEPEDFTLQRVKTKARAPVLSMKPESPAEVDPGSSSMKPLRERNRRLELRQLFSTLGHVAFKYNPHVAQLATLSTSGDNKMGIRKIMILEEARHLIEAQKRKKRMLMARHADILDQQLRLSRILQKHVEQFLRNGVPENIITNFLKSVSRAAASTLPKPKSNSSSNPTAEDGDQGLDYHPITLDEILKGRSPLRYLEINYDSQQSTASYETAQRSSNYDIAQSSDTTQSSTSNDVAQRSPIILQPDQAGETLKHCDSYRKGIVSRTDEQQVPGLYKKSLLNQQMIADMSSKERDVKPAQSQHIGPDVIMLDSKPDTESHGISGVGSNRQGDMDVDNVSSVVVNNTAQGININVNKPDMDTDELSSVVSADIHGGDAAASDDDEIRSSTGYDSVLDVLDEEMDFMEAEITGDNVVQDGFSKLSQDSATAVSKVSEENASNVSQECASKASEEVASKVSADSYSKWSVESASKTSEEHTSKVSEECASKTSDEHTTKVSEECASKTSEEHASQMSVCATTLPGTPAITDPLIKSSSDSVMEVSDFAPKVPECTVAELGNSDVEAALSDSDIICVP